MSETERILELCRLCLVEPQELEIFSKSLQLKLKYSEMVGSISDKIIIAENDDLPKGICHQCSLKLIQYFKFKRQIESVHVRLCEIFKIFEVESSAEIELGLKDELVICESQSVLEESSCKTSDCEQMKEEVYLVKHETLSQDEDNVDIEETEITEYIIDDLETVEQIEEEQNKKNIASKLSSENNFEIEFNFQSLIQEDFDVSDSNYEILHDDDAHSVLRAAEEQEIEYDDKISENGSYYAEKTKEIVQNWGFKKITDVKNCTADDFKKFECQICYKLFSSSSKLKYHDFAIHADLRPFKCDICNKKFNQKSHLTSHSRTHTSFRPYPCQECGRSFHKSCNLQRHMKVHRDETEFDCQYCDKKFKWKGSIEVHMSSHTGTKPFTCKHCEKCYTSYASLKKHRTRYNHL